METPKEEKLRLKLAKLEARTREKSGHEDAQKKTLNISPFKTINEGNEGNKGNAEDDEEPGRSISPLHTETHPELYETQLTTTTNDQLENVDMAANEEVEATNEVEIEVGYELEYKVEMDEKQVIDRSEIMSEIDYNPEDYNPEEVYYNTEEANYNPEEVDYDPEEAGPVFQDGEPLIKKEPLSEDGYERERETEEESADEPEETSSQRRVILKEILRRDIQRGARNRRWARRAKIWRDQATKPPQARLRVRRVTRAATRQRSPTPSTEINSDDEGEEIRTVSPQSTAMLDRNNSCYLRNLCNKKRSVYVREGEEEGEDRDDREEEEEPSDTDDE